MKSTTIKGSIKAHVSIAILAMSMYGTNANAFSVVDVGNMANQVGSFIENTLTAASSAIDAATNTITTALTKAGWIKSAEQAAERLAEIQKSSQKITDQTTGLRDVSKFLNLSGLDPKSDKYKFSYTPELPSAYVPSFTCTDEGKCSVGAATPLVIANANGYKGEASGVDSLKLREELTNKGADKGVLPSLGYAKTNTVRYAEAAEKNVHEEAIISAMAQEAYAQANNRIKAIETLQAKIGKPENKDLKAVADLQANLQSQQALLLNEQNKLAALAMIQQSQKDAYAQRKVEIESGLYKKSDDILTASGQKVVRGLILGATTAAFKMAAASYTTNPAPVSFDFYGNSTADVKAKAASLKSAVENARNTDANTNAGKITKAQELANKSTKAVTDTQNGVDGIVKEQDRLSGIANTKIQTDLEAAKTNATTDVNAAVKEGEGKNTENANKQTADRLGLDAAKKAEAEKLIEQANADAAAALAERKAMAQAIQDLTDAVAKLAASTPPPTVIVQQ